MSAFSEKCKELISENETNVYRLSNSASLERTALQRMVTGKRLPSVDFVKQFCQALRMSVPEREQLMELYKIEQIGVETYQKRKQILSMLDMLSKNEHAQNFEMSDFPLSVPADFSNSSEHQKYSTGLMVYFVMEETFSGSGVSSIYTNLPAHYETFFRQIQILFQRHEGRDVSIEHLFHFQIGSSSSIDNLNVLYRILPLAFSPNTHYTSWYYYSKVSQYDFIQSLFPYYIITPARVLEISGDLQTYILHSNPGKIRLYTKEFKKIKKMSTPLLKNFDKPNEAYTHYARQFSAFSKSVYILEGQPCFFDMADDDYLKRAIIKREDFIPISQNIWDFHKFFSDFEVHGFFTQKGLHSFWEDGIIYGQMGAAFSPFSKKERTILLENFLDRVPQHHRRMLKDSIPFPKNIYFEIFKDKQLHIIWIDDQLKVSSFLITESSICDSFYDFIISLEDPEFSLTEQESDDYLRALLKNCSY